MDKDKGSTQRFGYQWSTYDKIIPDYEEQFLKWIYPLGKKDFAGKKVLDAGCGVGRNSFWPLIYGAKEVVAFDYNQHTVEVAKKNLARFRNCKVSYDSIYSIPYKGYFDMAFSIGVIHHLEKPREAIKELVKSTKKGGSVLIWVYGYKGNEWIVRCINPIRAITSRIPPFLTRMIAYGFSIPLFAYLKLFRQEKPYLKQISNFRFWHVHCIVLDQLIPKIANYWTKEEAMKLFENQGLKEIRALPVNEMSWTVIGKKQ
jgi:SAM-dependent methyltransferase